jgi:Zn-finger domain-containing protein
MAATTNKNDKYEVPTILYEEPRPGEKPNILPYIEVSLDGKMPPVLFIFEYKQTGEFEPNSSGDPIEIVDQVPHKYVDMEHLKEKLPPHLNDMIRTLLGMKALKEAQKDGQVVLDKVNKNVERKLAETKGIEK